MQIRLEPMTIAQYADWLPGMLEGYAVDIAESRLIPLAAAREEANNQTDGLLPDGVDTPDHHLLTAYDVDEPVGSLWLRICDEQGMRRAFVFLVVVDGARRGSGYGRGIMLAGEEYARAEGASVMALNVFGPNEVARSLYTKIGYQVTSLTMQKPLE